MRTPSFLILMLLVACSAGTPADDTDTDSTSDTDAAGTSDTDGGDDTDAPGDTDVEAPASLLTNGGFEDPALTADPGSLSSPTMTGWEPAPYASFWGDVTLFRNGGKQFLQLAVACGQCVGQSLSDGLSSLRSADLGSAMAGQTCRLAAGVAPSANTLYDTSFEVRLTMLFNDEVIASSDFGIPSTGTNLTLDATLPAAAVRATRGPIEGPEGLRVELTLAQTQTLPAGSATATGASVYVDNVVLYCE